MGDVAGGFGVNRAPELPHYRCEVLAVGPVYGQAYEVPYVLAAFQTISPVLALRWLRGEALRIADRLDPDPTCSAWVRPAMRQEPTPAPDCPTELRLWCTSREEQRAARERIKSGDPLFAVIPDGDCRFTFSVWPVRLPTPERSPHQPPPWSYEPPKERVYGLAPSPLMARAGHHSGGRGRHRDQPRAFAAGASRAGSHRVNATTREGPTP